MRTLVFILLTALVLSACNSDSQNGSAEHQEVLVLSDSMIQFHERSVEIIDELKEIKDKLENQFAELTGSDSTLSKMIINVNEEIAVCEGLAEKHRLLIEQHKEYIDEHETQALGVDKIKLYHDQIKADFNIINKESLIIKSKANFLGSQTDKYLVEKVGAVIYK